MNTGNEEIYLEEEREGGKRDEAYQHYYRIGWLDIKLPLCLPIQSWKKQERNAAPNGLIKRSNMSTCPFKRKPLT